MATNYAGPMLELSSSASAARQYFASMPLGNDPDYVYEMIDFLVADDYDTTDWTATLVGAGSVAVQAGTKHGVLLLTNAAADNDSINIQRKTEAYKLESGKRLWFETLVQVSDADQCDFLIGLAITDTTVLDASDFVGFQVIDGDASIKSYTTKNSVSTAKDSELDFADATNKKLGFHFDGVSTVKFYIDRVLVSTHTTNICDDEELCISLNLTNGEAVAKTATIDYILVVKER